MHFKGRDKAILEMDLKLDDLLEKVKAKKGERRYTKTDRSLNAYITVS
jgi:hypothetical protein